MAATYEFPPALARHRPLVFQTNAAHQGALRFQHHFFLTRLKMIAFSVLRFDKTGIEEIRRLNNEVVRLFEFQYQRHNEYKQMAAKCPNQPGLLHCPWCRGPHSILSSVDVGWTISGAGKSGRTAPLICEYGAEH